MLSPAASLSGLSKPLLNTMQSSENALEHSPTTGLAAVVSAQQLLTGGSSSASWGTRTGTGSEPGIMVTAARAPSQQFDQDNTGEVEQSESCIEDESNNLKQLHTVQQWADGSSYKGHFAVDVKLGHGEFMWANGERYVGEFYKDHPHGKGIYIWPDISIFTGSFYLGRKEGYGTMDFLDHRKYQGLYRADERFGPGIETYQDDSQDVGFWLSDHLIRLPTKIPGSFSLLQYPEYVQIDYNLPQIPFQEKQSSVWTLSEEEKHLAINDFNSHLLKDSYTLPEKIHIYSNDTDHLPITSSFRKDFDSKFFQDNEQSLDADVPPNINNQTPLMVRMQKHIYKHRHNLAQVSWDVHSVINGFRVNFGPKGQKELMSEQLLTQSAVGDYQKVYEILRDNLAHVDVADNDGSTALHVAAVSRHEDIINLLLDNGADVNKLNDEGLSALSLCLVIYYPAESFKPNIGERNFLENMVQKAEDSLSDLNNMSLEAVPDKGKILEDTNLLQKTSSCFDIEPDQALICLPTDSGEKKPKKTSPAAFKPKRKALLSKNVNLVSGDAKKALIADEGTSSEGSRGSPESNLFDSNCSIFNFDIKISENILEWTADILSHNLPFQGTDENNLPEGTVRQMAQSKSEYRKKWDAIELLLRRGADPNSASVPMHALFFAVKAADVKAVQLLLEKGAKTDIQLPSKIRGLTPLHLAVALPGIEGVTITELLLHAGADPNARAEDQDHIYEPDRCEHLGAVAGFTVKGNNAPEVFCSYYMKPNVTGEEGGRTPLHVVCEREDCPKRARDIVHLLLQHSASPNSLWSGHSPLSLAIASGNDLVVKELLANGVETNLPLGRGVGSALCAAVNPAYEKKRTLQARISLVDKLINAGANVLMPITISHSAKTAVGTATDYGHYKFFQAKVEPKEMVEECNTQPKAEVNLRGRAKDKRIAHTPYHSLSHGQRDTVNARKRLLEHMGNLVRQFVTKIEKEWVDLGFHRDTHGVFVREVEDTELITSDMDPTCRKIAFKYCYQCGRSIGMKLFPCARCKAVFYCSKACQKKSWNELHKNECVRLSDQKNRETEKSKSTRVAKDKKDKKDKKKPTRIDRKGKTFVERNENDVDDRSQEFEIPAFDLDWEVPSRTDRKGNVLAEKSQNRTQSGPHRLLESVPANEKSLTTRKDTAEKKQHLKSGQEPSSVTVKGRERATMMDEAKNDSGRYGGKLKDKNQLVRYGSGKAHSKDVHRRDVSPSSHSKHVSPSSHSRHVSPSSHSRHVSPSSHGRHVSPSSHSRHVSPYSHSRHVSPYRHGRNVSPSSYSANEESDIFIENYSYN